MPAREAAERAAAERTPEMQGALGGLVADLGLIDAVTDTADEPDPAQISVAAAPEAQETAPQINYNPVIPADIEDLLDEPDDLDDTSPAAAAEQYGNDPDELARELARTQRQLEHERGQRIKVSRRAWEAEAAKFFPLADATSITADSRRSFLKTAKEQHGRNYQLLKPQLDKLAAQEKAAAEAEAAAVKATEAGKWGPVVTGAGGPPPSTTADERLQAARSKRDLRGSVRALIESGSV